jgi:Snf2-ATP coupling, chromatin remodelling complex
MQEDEIPDWVLDLKDRDSSSKSNVETNHFIGKRKRKEVIYTDLFSDIQWMGAMEVGEDPSEINRTPRARKPLSVAMMTSQDYGRKHKDNTSTAGDENWPVPKMSKKKRSKPCVS